METAMGSPIANPYSAASLGILGTEMIRIHDVYPAFVKLDVDGIAEYHTRAASLPGLVVIQSPLPDAYTRLLRDTNIGANRLWQVPMGSTLTESLIDGQHHLLRSFLDQGHKLECFLPTADQRKFVEHQLGFDYSQVVWGPSPELAVLTNSKIWLRRQFAGTKGVAFAEHQITSQADRLAITEYCHYLIGKYGGAIVKVEDQASGDGMIKLHDVPNWGQVLKLGLMEFKRRGFHGEVIVEAGYWEHIPLSVQMEVSDTGPEFILDTEQTMTDHTVHAGNIITNGANPKVLDEVRQQMREQALLLGWSYYRLGYRGHVGFDFMDTAHGLFLLESNARITGAMYPLGVGLQMEANGANHWAVVTLNIEPAHRWEYNRLHQTLSDMDMLFNGQRGVLPMAPGLLTINHGKRKAMVYCTGKDIAEANAYLDEVHTLLRPTID
jgi:hypothetical protein